MINIPMQEIKVALQESEKELCERCGAKQRMHICSETTKLGTFMCGISFEIQTQEIARSPKDFGTKRKEEALKEREELLSEIKDVVMLKDTFF